jgi:hypothetical protein
MEKMRPWNGKDKTGRFVMQADQLEYWKMQVDEGGTVWYYDWGTPRHLGVWCPSKMLTAHLAKLSRIGGIVTEKT